ncbi:restriction endonuclease subunit S [Pedobacter sp. FW305-3-2-15-E-R2A2]|uniref:restriction endonuclease subunit S n=1 Tax=Pedobacter sp. FW305-3-2-15-E-R2A2 TaxID=3140251 RepID=UPI00314042A1
MNNKLIPELRFPEFVNDGEWLDKSLIDTADKKVKWSFTGGPFGSNLKASDYTLSGFRIIQLQNIGDGEFNDDNKIYTSIEKANELLSCNIYSGDIIISKMGDPVGRACIIPNFLERCVMASDGIRLVIDEKNYSKYFIYSLINSKQIREAIEKKSTGSTRKRIGLDVLREVELIVPKSIKEQKKIADCLSSLDGVITAYNQKLELLKEHKKALMQNLFTQEGETVPKYRFPEFANDVEWVEKKLGQIANNLDSKRIPITSNQREKGDIPYYGASGIIDYVKGYIYDDNLLCISEDGANLIDRNYPIAFSITGKTWVNNHAHVLKFENSSTQLLVEKYLNSISIEDFLTGMAQPKLNRGNLDIIPIPLPKNPKEQQKIASCLSALDELITAQVKKIEQLKQHKKGLMQGLFPKMND